jgi:hypothetical protein
METNVNRLFQQILSMLVFFENFTDATIQLNITVLQGQIGQLDVEKIMLTA